MIKNIADAYKILPSVFCQSKNCEDIIEGSDSRVEDELRNGKYNFDIIGQSGLKPIGQPTITKNNTMYVGNTRLINETSLDQTMRTEIFSREETFTQSTKTILGFNIGIKASGKFTAKFLESGVETSIEVSAQFNLSNDQTTTKSETVTFTIPSQDILVPSKSIIKVTAIFNKVSCNGKVQLPTTVRGYDYIDCWSTGVPNPGGHPCVSGTEKVPFGKLARMANSSDFVPVANSDTEMTIMGIGEYSTDTATNFMLNIEQLDLN
ncbi:ETX/MTX2 family pore-forming toxin, partial [Clostridium botulinum]